MKKGQRLHGNGIRIPKRTAENIYKNLPLVQALGDKPSLRNITSNDFTFKKEFADSEYALVAFAFDDQTMTLFGASEDGLIFAWNLETYELIGKNNWTFKKSITSLVWLPAKSRLLITDDSGTLKALDSRLIELPLNCPNFQNGITCSALSEDQIRLYVGDESGFIHALDTETLSKKFTVQAHTERVVSLVLPELGNEEHLLSAGKQEVIKLWKVQANTLISQLVIDQKVESCLKITSDRTTFAYSTLNKDVCIWNLETSKAEIRFPMKSNCSTLEFNQNGSELYCGLKDGRIVIVSLDTKSIKTEVKGHQGPVNVILIDSQERFLCTGGWDSVIKIYENNTGRSTKKRYTFHKSPVSWNTEAALLKHQQKEISSKKTQEEGLRADFFANNTKELIFKSESGEDLIKFKLSIDPNSSIMVDDISTKNIQVFEQIKHIQENTSADNLKAFGDDKSFNLARPLIIRNRKSDELDSKEKLRKREELFHKLINGFDKRNQIDSLLEKLKEQKNIKTKVQAMAEHILAQVSSPNILEELNSNFDLLMHEIEGKFSLPSTVSGNGQMNSDSSLLNEPINSGLMMSTKSLNVFSFTYKGLPQKPINGTQSTIDNLRNTDQDSSNLYFSGQIIKGKKNGFCKILDQTEYRAGVFKDDLLGGQYVECNNEFVIRTSLHSDPKKSTYLKIHSNGATEFGYVGGKVTMLTRNGIKYVGDQIGVNYEGPAKLMFRDQSKMNCGIKNLRICA